MKILIVAENASTRFGGEAILPWHYFVGLRRRSIDVRMIVHQRTRQELLALMPEAADRLHFLPDTVFNRVAHRLGRFVPARIADITFGFLSRVSSQLAARRLARSLVTQYGIEIVHQPIPVSPREPSLLHGLGAPVIIGPMNGNMSFPPAFDQALGSRSVNFLVNLARGASDWLNRVMPGKLHASALLVANERTKAALPRGARGVVITLPENGVDYQTWAVPATRASGHGTMRVMFIGRLVSWKAVELLIEAFDEASDQASMLLEIIGEGPMRDSLERRARESVVHDRITFSGWRSQAECAERLRYADVLVLPSLYECGGAVVLEAMACGVPVIASNWGGPAEYVDETCGILVSVESPAALVEGMAKSLLRLAGDRALRERMGEAGRQRVRRSYDWNVKIDRMLEIYSLHRERA